MSNDPRADQIGKPVRILRDPVRDGLRDLVRAGVLVGWYSWNTADGRQMFTVRPVVGPCVTHDVGSAGLLVAGFADLKEAA